MRILTANDRSAMVDSYVNNIFDEEEGKTKLNPTSTKKENVFHGSKISRPLIERLRHLSIDEQSPLLNGKGSLPTRSSSLLKCWWQWYEQQVERCPVVTKSITAAVLVGSGDLAGQVIQKYRPRNEGSVSTSVDVPRFLRFVFMGLVLQAPITHFYYRLLDRCIPPTPSPWTISTLVKLLIDQLIFAPTFTILVFLFLDCMQGEAINYMLQHLEDSFGPTMVANWKLWVPATVLNLAFCPPAMRVLYCNIVFFMWSIYLSMLFNPTSSNATSIDNSALADPMTKDGA